MSIPPPAVEQRGKLDHIAIPVASWTASRDWYVATLGLEVEFEVPEAGMVAVRDEHDFTIFLQQGSVPAHPDAFALYFQVDDVALIFASLAAKGVPFRHPPQKTPWGFGAELSDPDGYLIRLWDEASMGSVG